MSCTAPLTTAALDPCLHTTSDPLVGWADRDFRLGLMTASQHPAFAAVNLWGKNERAVALAMATVERFYTAMADHNVVEELPDAETGGAAAM